MNIYDLPQKWLQNLWSFSFGFFIIHNIWSFLNNTSHFEIDAWTFDISFLRISLWLFRHHTFQYKSLFLFPSQILVYVMAITAYFLFLRFDICWDIKQKQKKSMGRYVGTSLCMYQNNQNYWSIIHDKLEDRFTTVTHRFQDFFHKDRCAYIIS